MNADKTYAESIAHEYAPQPQVASKVKALEKLDKKAKRPAYIFGWVFGIAMALVMGVGMCFSMGVLGGGAWMAPGIVIGIVGIAGAICNPLIFKKLLKSGKEKYASDIMRLAEEISGEK